MRSVIIGLSLLFLIQIDLYSQSCCPQILKSSLKSGNCVLTNGGSCGICSDAGISLLIEDGKNIPENSQISWYTSNTKGFNPSLGQGTLLGSSAIPSAGCDDAATVRFNEVMVKPATFDDNFAAGPKGEWIEIIGPPGMSLACYIITDGDWAITIPPGYSIGSDGLFVVGTSAASGPEVDLDVTGCSCVFSPATNPNNVLTLDNTGEYLLLFDGNSIIDAFRWGTPTPFNNFPFGDLVTAGQIPTADVIGCVQSVPFSLPTFMSNAAKSAVNESYARLPDYSGSWELNCPTIGKCNATAPGIFPLVLDIAPGGLMCNQTIYLRALLSPNKPGCTAVMTPEYSLFVSCPVKDFKKTICSNESILINGTNYDISNPSGVEVFVGGSYYGCDSTVNIDLSFFPEVNATISGDPEICFGQTANLSVTFSGVAPFTFTYNINGFFGGTITTNNNPYLLQLKPNTSIIVELDEVFDKNNCQGNVSGFSSISVDEPKASLSGLDSTLCAGDTMLIPVNLSGYPDYKIIYTVNGIEQAPITTANSVYYLPVIPNDTTIIKIKEVIDDLGCKASLSGIDTLYVRPPLEILNLEEVCNPGNVYDVIFVISGGYPASWMVTGGGTLTDSLFISTGNPGGSTYTFIVKDGSNCSADTISNTVLCNCKNKVGTMDQITLHACIDGTVTALYDNTNELLQAGDILKYILHDNSGNTAGFIFNTNDTPVFGFVAGMVPGKVYYISAVIGKELSPGIIDLNDECLRVALGTPVIFHDFPTYSVVAQQNICEGTCANLDMEILGASTFNLSFSISDKLGTKTVNETGISSLYNYIYCSPTNGGSGIVKLILTKIEDSYCNLYLNDTIEISVHAQSLINLNKDLCTGQTLLINGKIYSESNPSGVETISGGSYFGCDSLINVNLSFVNTVVENLSPVICINGSIIINGETFDQNNSSGSFNFPGGSIAGCDSVLNVQLNFLSIDTGYLAQSLCVGEQVAINGKIYDSNNPFGIETLGGWSWKGCDSVVIVDLSFYPVVNGYLKDSLCKSDILLINGNQYDINKPAGFEVFKNGSINGCDSTLQIQLLFLDDITASISGPSTVCPGKNVAIEINFSSSGIYDIDIDDGMGNIISLKDIPDGYIYNYSGLSATTSFSIVNVINKESNCQVLFGPDLVVSTGSLVSSIQTTSDYNGVAISCSGSKDASLKIITQSGTAPFTYNWSTGAVTDTLTKLGAGDYTVTIIDANGCQALNMITLTEPEAIFYNYATTDASCLGTGTGEIKISNISGGVPAYTYSINNAISKPVVLPITVTDLAPGTYTLTFADKNGCTVTDVFNIFQTTSNNLFLDLGPDITIESGKQIGLTPDLNFIPADIAWNPSVGLNCSNCLDPVFKNDTSTTYILSLKDENGCEIQDKITIIVLDNNILFVPNVFSPNGDGINDKLNVFTSDQVKAIKRFAIFDRWGESLYDVTDFPLNDTNYGWDGKQRGNKASQGVYVYYLIVTLQDGTDKVFKGDITLNR